MLIGFEAAREANGLDEDVVAVAPPNKLAPVDAVFCCAAGPPKSDPAAEGADAAAPPNSVPAGDAVVVVFPNKLPLCVVVTFVVDAPNSVPADAPVEPEPPKRPPDFGGNRLPEDGACDAGALEIMTVLVECMRNMSIQGSTTTHEFAAPVLMLSPPGGPLACPKRLPMAGLR